MNKNLLLTLKCKSKLGLACAILKLFSPNLSTCGKLYGSKKETICLFLTNPINFNKKEPKISIDNEIKRYNR